MNTISLKVPKALNAKLAVTAKRRGASKSAIVREAIEDYFARNGTTSSLSVAELAKELIGCVDGGPPDLSYNKKHMKGYGK
jgi:predicted transcriptional regulator